MSMEGYEPMRLKGDRFTGLEHHVWLDGETGIVSKIPSDFGQIWQDMRPEAVERDLEIMDEFGIPTVETRVYGPQTVAFDEAFSGAADETRRVARYVLKQPLIKPAHAMTYADLLHSKKQRDTLLEIVQQREDIKQRHGLGLDLLGGQGFQLVGPALNPRVKTMRADVGNLLVPEADVQTNGSWAEHAIKSNGFVARKGESLLCDTRLMPIGEANGWYERVLSPIMRKNREFQDAALWATLEGLGVDPNTIKADQRFDTGFKRLVRKLALHAKPKMVAEAEKMN
jgi:hypothetical protein